MTRASLVAGALMALCPLEACSSSSGPPCSAPSSGSFSLQVGSGQPVAVAIACEAGAGGATACSSEPLPFESATWTVAVDGSGATVTSGGDAGASWACQVTPPSSSTCYLLVTCGPEPLADAGPGDVELELLASGSNDVVVLVHEVSGECCAYSYTGTWQP